MKNKETSTAISKKYFKSKNVEEALKASGQQILSILESIQDGFIALDKEWCFIYLNKETERIFNVTREELIGRNIWEVFPNFIGTKFFKEYKRAVKEGVTICFEELYSPLNMYFEVNAHPSAEVLSIYFKDITDRRRSHEIVDHVVYHDLLTDLPNIKLFKDRLGQAISFAKYHHESLAVLFIDLDRFKTLNDTLGSHSGDVLLKEMANRLNYILPKRDTVSRINSDEFICFISNVSRKEAIDTVQKVMAHLSKPVMVYGNECVITPSIGVSLYPFDGEDPDILMSNAESATFHSKKEGRNQYRLYTEEMNFKTLKKLSLDTDLRKAIEHDELKVYYQPQVDVKTGLITGVEALLRWKHPRLGFVSPAEFIPLAEDTGLIISIGEWVFEQACKQLKAWHDQGLPKIPVSINFSARQFQQGNLVEMVEKIIKETQIEPHYLKVEVTESVMMTKLEVTLDILKRLKDMGIHIAIDDFGTYYSSLQYLKNFPLDIIKIDISFIRDMVSSPTDMEIVRMIIELGHRLGMRVVAEGIENEEQIKLLKSLECDEVQGFLFSKALPAEQIKNVLMDQKILC